MKNRLSIPLLATILTVLMSCGASNSEKESNTEGQIEQTNLDPEAKGGNTCLLGYRDKLSDLLTGEMAVAATGLSADEMETKQNNKLKNLDYHSIQYKWKTDKTEKRTVANMTLDVPVIYSVELGGLKERSFKDFKASYRKATKEQLEQAKKAMDEAFDRKSGNDKVNEKLDKLDELGVDKATQKATAGSIGSVIGEIAQAYSDVDGVGDAASWNSIEKTLYVLDDGVQFSITIQMSDDNEANREKAIKLAKEIIIKCG